MDFVELLSMRGEAGVLVGDTAALITKPNIVGRVFHHLTLEALSGDFRFRIGDNTEKEFTAAATDICTSVGHGLTPEDGPLPVHNSGGGLPGGLAVNTKYWPAPIDDDTFYLCASLSNAVKATPVPVNITSAGTGTHTIGLEPAAADPSASETDLMTWHKIAEGQVRTFLAPFRFTAIGYAGTDALAYTWR